MSGQKNMKSLCANSINFWSNNYLIPQSGMKNLIMRDSSMPTKWQSSYKQKLILQRAIYLPVQFVKWDMFTN
jgi:hypothetical protein